MPQITLLEAAQPTINLLPVAVSIKKRVMSSFKVKQHTYELEGLWWKI